MREYKGYTARVEFLDNVLHGEIVGIRDVVTFEAESVADLQKAFEDSVDDYLEFCAERGEEPNKSFSGQFVVRATPELHRRVYLKAATTGESMNAWIARVLERETKDSA